MKNLRGLLTCLGVLSLMASTLTPATAAQSFFGYTGLILTPTTDTQPQGGYALGAYLLNPEHGSTSMVYAGTYGLAQGLEIGYNQLKTEHQNGMDYFNAKYRFAPATSPDIAFAIGVLGVANNETASPYLVASKTVSVADEASFGEINALQVNVGVGGGNLDGIFGGVSAVLGKRLTLMIEHDTNDFNYGARLALSNEFRLHGAIIAGNDVGLGLSWNKSY